MKRVSEQIEKTLKNLPKTPGVYQMKDKKDKVIYVGKAKNLHARVHSYFRDTGSLTIAKKNMVSQIATIETILCQTEVEALVLETNLIKHLSPKYNILMKDDKNLTYIKITPSPVAEIIKTRNRARDGADYFGPFTQGANISESLKNLRRIFRVRACKMQFQKRGSELYISDKAGRGIPCMDYYIGICPAPCLLQPKNLEEHAHNVARMKEFLKGKTAEVIDMLTQKMHQHAKKLEFEKAAKLKEEIAAITILAERQIARDAIAGNHDIVVFLEKYSDFFMGITRIRDGKIIAVMRFVVDTKGESVADAMVQCLAREYTGESDDFPHNIIIEHPIEDASLNTFFTENDISVTTDVTGKKKELLDFSKNQLREFAYKRELERLETKTLTRAHMENVLTKLGYTLPKKGPIVFECYDISHTHGQFTYASRVVIKNGKPDPSSYKKYKIKTLPDGEIDDFASHKEVMMRRTVEGCEQENFPHLIIIDGGKGQLSSALEGIAMGKKKYSEEN